jgi:hypothetical protein
MRKRPVTRAWVAPPPTRFAVGEHTLLLTMTSEGRWTVAVDGVLVDRVYGTQVEAWEAGVRHADGLVPAAP